MKRKDNIFLGSGLILLAATAYACMGALVKWGGNTASDEQLVFMRNCVCLVLLLPWIFLPKPKTIKTAVFKTHFFRAAFGLLNMYLFFYSIRFIVLSDATLLNNTMPLFIPLLLWIWDKERPSKRILWGIIIGFFGVILILHPTLAILNFGSLAALGSGLCMACSMLGIRELQKKEPLYRILFYYFALATLLSVPLLFGNWHTLPFFSWLALVGVGVAAALYQFFLTKGYQFAPSTTISPLIYFAVILSGIFEWIFWGIVPTFLSYLGVLFVVLGTFLCVFQNGLRSK